MYVIIRILHINIEATTVGAGGSRHPPIEKNSDPLARPLKRKCLDF